MTKTEYNWTIRAIKMLDEGQISKMQEAKILRTISQIFGHAANRIEREFNDQVDEILAHDMLLTKIRQ